MRCNCPIDDRTCQIDSKLFHLTNRTNRSNRQHFVHFSLIKWNFSDPQQIERCFVGWTHATVLDMSEAFRSTSSRPILSEVSVKYQRSISEVSAKYQRGIGELKTISADAHLHIYMYISSDYCPSVGPLSTDSRPTLGRCIG